MKFYFVLIIVTVFLIAGCTNKETDIIEGKINKINNSENTLVVYVDDTLTEKQKSRQDFEEDDKVIEAFLVETTNNTAIKGEVNSFDELKLGHKVSLEIKGRYEKELVTVLSFLERQENLPTYKAVEVTVVPYTKKDIVEGLTVDKGQYALYIYNVEDYNIHSNLPDKFRFQKIVLTQNDGKGGIKNEKELLGLYDNSTTFIITDDKEIVYKTDDKKALIKFIEKLDFKESTK